MDNQLHVSIDLETLDTRPSAVVTEIGISLFTMQDGIIKNWSTPLPLQEQLDKGRTVSASTLLWWLTQGEQARQCMIDGQAIVVGRAVGYLLEVMLTVIQCYAKHTGREVVVWGNGATFDVSILESLLATFGYEPCWQHWNVRDMRTLVSLAPQIREQMKAEFEGVPHTAMDDARHQARVIRETLRSIRGESCP